jgi:transglutaminase-like putative cysteine protease
MRLKIIHDTHYAYDTPVKYALQQLRVTPLTLPNQSVTAWSSQIEHGKVEVEYTDHNGNIVNLVSVEPDASHFNIRCEGVVETIDTNGIFGLHSGYVPLWAFQRPTELTTAGKGVTSIVSALPKDLSGLDVLHRLSDLIWENVAYKKGTTTSETTAEEALKLEAGVCQDHSHIFIAAARKLGFPARYVSGYLAIDDQIDQDAGHAWAEAYVNNLGWVGFDVSNKICPNESYVRVASGLDAREAAPITGTVSNNASEELSVSIQVQQQ